MSLITQCPACATLFKVVQDQLRISEGWVRCGQCDRVFDANAHLQSLDLVQASSVESNALATHAEIDAPARPPELAACEVSSPALSDHPIEASAPIESAELPEPDLAHHEAEVTPDADSGGAQDASLNTDAQAHGLSFMKDAAKGVSRYSVVSVYLWGLSLVLLLALLAVQVLVQQRDRLAALEPELRPMLESLCGVLGCELSHVRQIESVVIESSSFVNVQGSVYRLNVTLKNTAPFAVALPAIELTLTDLQDQAVMRRVIAAGEFRSTSLALAADAELQTTFPLNVKLSAGVEKFSGYRLVIFYP